MLMTNDDEENFNEEISLQNYKHDDSIESLTQMGLIRQQDEYYENKLLFLGSFVIYYHF